MIDCINLDVSAQTGRRIVYFKVQRKARIVGRSARKGEPDNMQRRYLVQERKFPGPAGILPHRKSPARSNENLRSSKGGKSSPSPGREITIVCSSQEQRKEHLLWKGPRVELLQYLHLDPDNQNCPINTCNIDWIVKTARKYPARPKVPFLLAVVFEEPKIPQGKQDEYSTCQAILLDPTGEPFFPFLHFVSNSTWICLIIVVYRHDESFTRSRLCSNLW